MKRKSGKDKLPSVNPVNNWEKEIVLRRLEEIKKDPAILKPIIDFFDDPKETATPSSYSPLPNKR